MMILAITITLIQLTFFASFVYADDPIKIIDWDEYTKEVSAGQTATYNWTLENEDTAKTYEVSLNIISNSDSDWSVQMDPDTPITITPTNTSTVSLMVTAPSNVSKGSTIVRLKFIIRHNGNVVQWGEWNTTSSIPYIPKPEKEKVLDWFENPLPSPLDNEWGIFLLTVLIWLGFSFLLILILDPCVKAATKKTKTEVDDIILRIIRTPLLVLVFFYGVVSSLIILEDHIPKVVIDAVSGLYGVVAVLIIFYVAYKLFKDILVYYGELIAQKTSSNIDDVIVPIVEKVGVVIIALVALGYVLGYLNIDLTLFVAGGVVISMVIAFAAQETLSNFFSGIFILTDRPFKEGDKIILPDGDWYQVRNIGMRSTRLFRFKDASLVTIPNNNLANEKIANFSNPDDLGRVMKTVGVAYGTDSQKVKKILREVIMANEDIVTEDEDFKPIIRFEEMADSSINFFILVWVKDRDKRHDVGDYLNTEIYRRFNKEGIEIPFPQRVIHVKEEKGGKKAGKKG
jgi:small-conductance mechanosensitive channel